VQEFVMRYGLLPGLRETALLAAAVFDVSEPITLFAEVDPDTGERWIEMNVAARGSIEQVMAAHDSFTERQLSLPNSPARQIRLFVHIARD
jgi:hypothetical protein